MLSLCAARICRLVLAEAVREEVEENLLLHAGRLSSVEADELIENYRRLIQLTKPELIPYPDADSVQANRRLIRHEADVPVLLTAMAAKPDWLLSNNTKHFSISHRPSRNVLACVSQRLPNFSRSYRRYSGKSHGHLRMEEDGGTAYPLQLFREIRIASPYFLFPQGGYLLDSGSPHMLWFRFRLGSGVKKSIQGNWLDCHRLLRETEEELAAAF